MAKSKSTQDYIEELKGSIEQKTGTGFDPWLMPMLRAICWTPETVLPIIAAISDAKWSGYISLTIRFSSSVHFLDIIKTTITAAQSLLFP